MAKRKKRPKLRRALRGKARKASKSKRTGRTKRAVARAKLERAGAKKTVRKKEQRLKPPRSAVETVVSDVIEEPAPGVITVTEFEETEIREGTPDRDKPEER